MRRAVYGFLGMRIFRMGDVLLQQLQGIPIGGPLSGCILEIVLSRCETMYDAANPSRFRHLAVGRYVDDLILLSRTLCRECVRAVIVCVYKNIVVF
jgi:hypothetical protein